MSIAISPAVQKLCDKVSVLTGQMPVRYAIDHCEGRFRADFFEVAPVLARLNKGNRERFMHYAAGVSPHRDERSQYVSLTPVEVDGLRLHSLRFKGIRPKLGEKQSSVLPYTAGTGFVSSRLFVDLDNPTVIEDFKLRPEHYAPHGTITREAIETETLSALVLGSQITDPILGFGIFKDLEYLGEPVGYVVYGMEREEDARLHTHLSKALRHPQKALENMKALAIDTGVKLAAGNRAGLGFVFSWLGNFALHSPTSTRLVDLDSTSDLPIGSTEAVASALFIDVSTTLQYYYRGLCTEGGISNAVNRYPSFFPYFLNGYFGDSMSASFEGQIAEAMQRSRLESDGSFMIANEPAQGLIAPRTAFLDGRSQVDLRDFRSSPLFRLFYEHLLWRAEEINSAFTSTLKWV